MRCIYPRMRRASENTHHLPLSLVVLITYRMKGIRCHCSVFLLIGTVIHAHMEVHTLEEDVVSPLDELSHFGLLGEDAKNKQDYGDNISQY